MKLDQLLAPVEGGRERPAERARGRHDPADKLLELRDQSGTTRYDYNEVNLVVQLTEPCSAPMGLCGPGEIGPQTRFAYDDNNNRKERRRCSTSRRLQGDSLNKMTDLRQKLSDRRLDHRTGYDYDGLNRLTKANTDRAADSSRVDHRRPLRLRLRRGVERDEPRPQRLRHVVPTQRQQRAHLRLHGRQGRGLCLSCRRGAPTPTTRRQPDGLVGGPSDRDRRQEPHLTGHPSAWLAALELDLRGQEFILPPARRLQPCGPVPPARRARERGLRRAAESAVAALGDGGDSAGAAAGLFDALIPAIPYAPAASFLGREKAKLVAREGEPPRVAIVTDAINGVHGVTRTIEELRGRGVPGFEVEVVGTDRPSTGGSRRWPNSTLPSTRGCESGFRRCPAWSMRSRRAATTPSI